MTPISFDRYLDAKKTVDDRALNRHVWQQMVAALPPQSAAAPLRVLEVGAGTGSMAQRMVQWGAVTHADYTLVDAQADLLARAAHRLELYSHTVQFQFESADLYDITIPAGHAGWDLLIAHAVLDLLDVPRVLQHLLPLLKPGGVFYFTINFDGATIFEPAIDPALDTLIERVYHRTMDERITDGRVSGDSRSGRHLIHHLRAAGATVTAAGSSDWVVFGSGGRYPADEATFLRAIVGTLDNALRNRPELAQAPFARWIAQRYRQIEQGDLVYIAHQLDVTGRTGSGARTKITR